MPIWGWYWGPGSGVFGWIFPLVGLVLMVTMAFFCFRLMRTMTSGCMTGHGSPAAGNVDDLRREVRELKEQMQKLRDRS